MSIPEYTIKTHPGELSFPCERRKPKQSPMMHHVSCNLHPVSLQKILIVILICITFKKKNPYKKPFSQDTYLKKPAIFIPMLQPVAFLSLIIIFLFLAKVNFRKTR